MTIRSNFSQATTQMTLLSCISSASTNSDLNASQVAPQTIHKINIKGSNLSKKGFKNTKSRKNSKPRTLNKYNQNINLKMLLGKMNRNSKPALSALGKSVCLESKVGSILSHKKTPVLNDYQDVAQ